MRGWRPYPLPATPLFCVVKIYKYRRPRPLDRAQIYLSNSPCLMASTLVPFRPAGGAIRASSASSDRGFKSQSSSKWWTPLFGWSSDPDYMDSNSKKPIAVGRSRFAPGGFTEEKAKQLRVKTLETTAFHDIMYHSAIASRLASDVSK